MVIGKMQVLIYYRGGTGNNINPCGGQVVVCGSGSHHVNQVSWSPGRHGFDSRPCQRQEWVEGSQDSDLREYGGAGRIIEGILLFPFFFPSLLLLFFPFCLYYLKG
ncbi:hypothetical protein M501DRAFT_679368 [Patellaria atrata CBS 101060]|uniref:Uncharacterized protein n=1 Tax=Patellaria atrata CBS 101060 TaxID=1346257 RepID=A0A9P4VNU5_9PEZI|nr:hypothetical protein M501DRAFT_679368 [Patellaria atrata CBS 101060]